MNNISLVSVIIPFYNTPDDFFREAIESVFAQDHKNWELLLVDDGSTGGCTEIAKYYADDYPERVTYIQHPGQQNRGASATRNLGIKHAKGEFIAFLDSDDVWFPHKLEQQVTILNSKPEVEMVYGRSQYWWSWMNNPEDQPRDRIQEHGIGADIVFKSPTLLTLFLQGRLLVPNTSSMLLRRKMIEGIGGFEEVVRGDKTNAYNDQTFFCKAYLESQIYVSNQCWDRYRQHPDSMCAVAAKNGRGQKAHMMFLDWIAQHLSNRSIRNNELWQVLKTEKVLRHYWGLGRPIKRVQRFIWRRKGTYPFCVKK